MRICFKIVLCLASLLSSASVVQAEVKLPTAFSDHMVMQHGIPVPVWGWADAGEKVTVQIGKQTKTTIANAEGKWMLKLDKLKAGGPYSLTISGKNKIVISDVYV